MTCIYLKKHNISRKDKYKETDGVLIELVEHSCWLWQWFRNICMTNSSNPKLETDIAASIIFKLTLYMKSEPRSQD